MPDGDIVSLFDLVKARPLEEKASHQPSCPYCAGQNLTVTNSWTTLLGGGDGTVDGNPNHAQFECVCRDCGAGSIRHTRYGNVWYTDTSSGRVLSGMPSCFERFEYRCARCRTGWMHRTYTDLDGETPARWLQYSSDGTKHFRTFYGCDGCGYRAETEEDYWRGGPVPNTGETQ